LGTTKTELSEMQTHSDRALLDDLHRRRQFLLSRVFCIILQSWYSSNLIKLQSCLYLANFPNWLFASSVVYLLF